MMLPENPRIEEFDVKSKKKLSVCQIDDFIVESKWSRIFGQFDLFEITRRGNDMLINR